MKQQATDILAYYFSEYDMRAFEQFGYATQAAGFEGVAPLFDKKPSYLRRLRDEYDVVTNSHRNGQKNRAPRSRIIDTSRYLSSFSFEELTGIVRALIENKRANSESVAGNVEEKVPTVLSEKEVEDIINFKDETACIRVKMQNGKVRVYNTSIIQQLKRLYNGCCQLCGENPLKQFNVDICEAHHIDYYAKTQNNDSANIIILCPNHHRLIHRLNPVFQKDVGRFVFDSGETMKIKIDYHLVP